MLSFVFLFVLKMNCSINIKYMFIKKDIFQNMFRHYC